MAYQGKNNYTKVDSFLYKYKYIKNYTYCKQKKKNYIPKTIKSTKRKKRKK